MAARKPTRLKMIFLLGFHAVLSGAFLVAYLTGDEDTYGMHLFAGYTVLAALALRLLAGVVAPSGSPLRLPRPSWSATRAYFARLARFDADALRQRSPLYAVMGVAVLAGVGLAAASGVLADAFTLFEDPHEALSEFALAIVIGHVVLVFLLHGLKVLASPPSAAPAPGAGLPSRS